MHSWKNQVRCAPLPNTRTSWLAPFSEVCVPSPRGFLLSFLTVSNSILLLFGSTSEAEPLSICFSEIAGSYHLHFFLLSCLFLLDI